MDQPYYIPTKRQTFLDLSKPIIFFDLETTGTNPLTDRIVELCAIKLYPDGNKEDRYYLLNPTIPISAGAAAVHGYTDEMVANQPTFGDLIEELFLFFKDCDLGGYNIKRFDVPMLMEEFHRFKKYPIHYSEVRLIDAMSIYHSKEKRDLSAAVKFYCDREHDQAHSAKADVLATIDILKHQLLRYNDLEPNTSFLHDFTNSGNSVDMAGKFVRNEKGEVVFNFGQHKGKPACNEPDYLKWMLGGDFSIDTKMVANRIYKNCKWEKEIKNWLDKEEILLDKTLASALYTTIKFEKHVPPFTLLRDEDKLTVYYNKQLPVKLSLPHRDAVEILLNSLDVSLKKWGGYEKIKV